MEIGTYILGRSVSTQDQDRLSSSLLHTSHLLNNLLKKALESCFTDEEPGALRGGETCPGPHPECTPRSQPLTLGPILITPRLPDMPERKPWPLSHSQPPFQQPGLSLAQTRAYHHSPVSGWLFLGWCLRLQMTTCLSRDGEGRQGQGGNI